MDKVNVIGHGYIMQHKICFFNQSPVHYRKNIFILIDLEFLAVVHKEFQSLDIRSLTKENGIIYDIKGILPREIVNGRL